jgi:predicted nucleotidyltransferase
LSEQQTEAILHAVSDLGGPAAQVYLFGSRLDGNARGGDVDLLVETDAPLPLLDRARLKMRLENQLGLPVDVLVRERGKPPTPFQTIARARARKLEAGA